MGGRDGKEALGQTVWAQWMTQGVEFIPTSLRGKKAKRLKSGGLCDLGPALCLWASVLAHGNVIGVQEERRP